MPSPRARALAVALVLVPLAGCSFSSDNVSCSGTSCTATLKGDGASAEILGTTVDFSGVQDGRATRNSEIKKATGDERPPLPIDSIPGTNSIGLD